MIDWIKQIEATTPHRAHYWCNFLEATYQISGHNATVLSEITRRLSSVPANTRYTEGIAALNKYSRDHLAKGHVGSLNGHTYKDSVAAAKKLASEYAGVPEIAELFTELAKPTVGGKK